MKLISHTIEVVKSGETLYYKVDGAGARYTSLDFASTTTDYTQLGVWKRYAENDVTQGGLTSSRTVKVEVKAVPANVDSDIDDAIAAKALKKLTQIEKDALGL